MNKQIFNKKSLCRKEIMNSMENWKTFPINTYGHILLMLWDISVVKLPTNMTWGQIERSIFGACPTKHSESTKMNFKRVSVGKKPWILWMFPRMLGTMEPYLISCWKVFPNSIYEYIPSVLWDFSIVNLSTKLIWG